MKRNYLFLSVVSVVIVGVLLLWQGDASAQTWAAAPSGVTNDLNNISCPDANTCYVVGGAPFTGGPGIILKTTNGGGSWSAQTIPTTNPLRGVSCPSSSTCYAAGDGGSLLKTTNGGTTWTAQHAPNLTIFGGGQPWFWDVWATSESSAVAIGNVGAIYRTTNGGSSWVQIQANVNDQNLTGVFFANSSTGWVMGGSIVLKTTNGGTGWTNQTPADASFPWDAYSLDGSTVWISGSTVHKSTNGGSTWIRLIGSEGITYRGVHFVDSSTGWIVGAGGTIKKTVNGGTSWTGEPSGTGVILRDVECESATLCYTVGDDGVILKYGAAAAPAVDTTPPDTTITTATAAPSTSSTEVTFGFNATEVATFGCALESSSGPYFSCTSPKTYTGLSVGTHTFYVRATDSANNTDASPAAHTWTIITSVSADTTSPSPPTNLRRTTANNDTTPTFTWLASPSADVTSYFIDISETTGGTNLLSQDIGRVLTYTVPASSALTPGATTYIFHVRAKDAAGNVSSVSNVSFILTAGAGESQLQSRLPDLTMSNITFSAQALRMTLRNQGTGVATTPEPLGLGLQWLDANNEPLGAEERITTSPLVARAARTIQLTSTRASNATAERRVLEALFRTPPAGAMRLKVRFDPANDVAESNETNNESTVSRPLSDLVFRKATFSAGSLRLEIRNQGAAATGSFGIGLEWLDGSGASLGAERVTTTRIPARDNRMILLTPTRATNATAGRRVFDALFRIAPTGATRLKVTLDPANEVAESNDGNNENVASIPARLVR